MADAVIALFEFDENAGDVTVALEKHYRLVPPDELTAEDLQRYAQARDEGVEPG
jgi:hypothetical protein